MPLGSSVPVIVSEKKFQILWRHYWEKYILWDRHRVVGRRHWRVRRLRGRWCWKSRFRERMNKFRWQGVASWRLIACFTATLSPTMGHRVVGRQHWRVRRLRRRWCLKSRFRERRNGLRWDCVASWRLIACFTATLSPIMLSLHMRFQIVFTGHLALAERAREHMRKFCVHVIEVTVQIWFFGKAILCIFAWVNTALKRPSMGLLMLTADRLECYL